ncbi:hypothetical protein [Streptomyces sodiiphilus]
MRIRYATDPGSPATPNEDFAATALPASGAGGAVVLLDGVTPPQGPSGCLHDVPWFTSRLGGELLGFSVSHPDVPLAGCLAEAIGRTAATHRPGCDLSHPRTPQATVAAARWGDAGLEYLVLSDAVLLLEEPGGGVRAVLDDRLDAVRARARRLPSGPQRAAFIEEARNTEGGFFTAAADPAVAGRAVTGTVHPGGVRRLAALSDGATRWTEVFGFGGWRRLFALLAGEGPEALIGQVRAAERSDPGGTAFPRGKIHDDATALVAELRAAGP